MKTPKTISRFVGGIGEFIRESTIPDAYGFGQSIDVRSDPENVTLLPRTLKESGTIIQALPKWGEYIPSNNTTYIYDEGGNIYSRDSTPTYTLLHTVPSSHGNGMSWFGEDNFIYYTSDTLIGRYGPVGSSTATFVDDFFGSQGGTPLNTNSLQLLSASTQYASRADTASLSITGSLSVEAWIKPITLPTGSGQMTLVSKWTENGNVRSYKFGIGVSSNYFGDGSDGALTIAADTTESPIDSACTGTSGTYTLTATNVSFAAGQIIYIHQTQGTGAGSNQRNTIQTYTAGTITTVLPLNANYTTGAQVRVLKQYTNVTINSGKVYTAKAWDGTTGGILGFLANGIVTVTGTITASNKGFRGGAGSNRAAGHVGYKGESYTGLGAVGGQSGPDPSNAGGGGAGGTTISGGGGPSSGCGAGGGYGIVGETAGFGGPGIATGIGIGGSVSGSTDLTTAMLGSGGGGGYDNGNGQPAAHTGGAGGGFINISGVTITVTGAISANGQTATGGSTYSYGGGGGSGGSILLNGQVTTMGTGLITATGGARDLVIDPVGYGGAGGVGRINLNYLTSYTGTTSPTLNTIQDSTLGSSNGNTLFLSISSNGTNVETYTKPANLVTGIWQNVAVNWDFTNKTCELFLAGVSLGTVVGTLSGPVDNASTFNIGMDRDGSSNPQHLYNGLIDEVRLWAGVRTIDDIVPQMFQQINSASAGLVGYWQFNAVATDATSNANNLTLTGAPIYTTDVPFASPTTRVDIDQEDTAATGNTYTLLTAISETSADRKLFTPAKDPQKSLRVYISAIGAGTGSWTLTIHDQYNNVIATKTVAKSALAVGNYEFIFDPVWRPLTNFTNSYHFHLTDSDGTGQVKTNSAADLSTVNYTTYYAFMISDTQFHPVAKFLQFTVFGNERYVGTYEATIYDPNAIALPAGYRVHCFGYWQEYLAIGCIKGDDVTAQDLGRIYFWDGAAITYNFYVDVPEGGVTALLGSRGDLFLWAGYQSDMLVYKGGYLQPTVTKLRRLPFMDAASYSKQYPGAVTMWKSLIRWGSPGESNSSSIYRGVYSYGHTNDKYPDILTYDYPISTGNTQTMNLRIGLTMAVNQNLLIGWADGTGYGIDNVNDSNSVYPSGTIEFLVEDNDSVWKEKLINNYVIKTSTLQTGETITPKIRIDGTDLWTLGETLTSTSPDPTTARMINTDERYYEVQYGINITSTGTTPSIKGVGVEQDLLPGEKLM